MALTEKEVKQIRDYLGTKEVKARRDILRAISGQVRFNILAALGQTADGMTVSELAKLFHYSVSRVSHQLRILRTHHIVSMRRNGKSMVYHVADNPFLKDIIRRWQDAPKYVNGDHV